MPQEQEVCRACSCRVRLPGLWISLTDAERRSPPLLPSTMGTIRNAGLPNPRSLPAIIS